MRIIKNDKGITLNRHGLFRLCFERQGPCHPLSEGWAHPCLCPQQPRRAVALQRERINQTHLNLRPTIWQGFFQLNKTWCLCHISHSGISNKKLSVLLPPASVSWREWQRAACSATGRQQQAPAATAACHRLRLRSQLQAASPFWSRWPNKTETITSFDLCLQVSFLVWTPVGDQFKEDGTSFCIAAWDLDRPQNTGHPNQSWQPISKITMDVWSLQMASPFGRAEVFLCPAMFWWEHQ